MKIVLAASMTLPNRRANTMQVMKMAQAMTALGHQVTVTVPGNPPEMAWLDLAAHYGLRERFQVVWLPIWPCLRRYDYALRALAYARRQAADLFYTRMPQAAAWAGMSGFPVIFEIHDMPSGRMGPLFLRLFLRSRGARRVVCITRALQRDLAQAYVFPLRQDFVQVAPDGVDLERFANLPVPKSARLALGLPERFTVGYTGHLYPGRGTDLLLALAQRIPEIGVIVAGGDPQDVARFKYQARDLPNLTVTGFLPNAELPRWQAACDVLLMPYQPRVSDSSGGNIARYLSPMKVFEYLASGRAILSSDLPVLREVLNSDNAVLLPPQDVAAWEQAIRALQADVFRRRALGEQAAHHARQYSWRERAARILEGISNESH